MRGEAFTMVSDACTTLGQSMRFKDAPSIETINPLEQTDMKKEEQAMEIFLSGRWDGGAGAAVADGDAVVESQSIASSPCSSTQALETDEDMEGEGELVVVEAVPRAGKLGAGEVCAEAVQRTLARAGADCTVLGACLQRLAGHADAIKAAARLSRAAAHAGQPMDVAEDLGSLHAQLRTSEAALATTKHALDQMQSKLGGEGSIPWSVAPAPASMSVPCAALAYVASPTLTEVAREPAWSDHGVATTRPSREAGRRAAAALAATGSRRGAAENAYGASNPALQAAWREAPLLPGLDSLLVLAVAAAHSTSALPSTSTRLPRPPSRSGSRPRHRSGSRPRPRPRPDSRATRDRLAITSAAAGAPKAKGGDGGSERSQSRHQHPEQEQQHQRRLAPRSQAPVSGAALKAAVAARVAAQAQARLARRAISSLATAQAHQEDHVEKEKFVKQRLRQTPSEGQEGEEEDEEGEEDMDDEDQDAHQEEDVQQRNRQKGGRDEPEKGKKRSEKESEDAAAKAGWLAPSTVTAEAGPRARKPDRLRARARPTRLDTAKTRSAAAHRARATGTRGTASKTSPRSSEEEDATDDADDSVEEEELQEVDDEEDDTNEHAGRRRSQEHARRLVGGRGSVALARAPAPTPTPAAPALELNTREQRALRRELALPATVNLSDPDAATVVGAVMGAQAQARLHQSLPPRGLLSPRKATPCRSPSTTAAAPSADQLATRMSSTSARSPRRPKAVGSAHSPDAASSPSPQPTKRQRAAHSHSRSGKANQTQNMEGELAVASSPVPDESPQSPQHESEPVFEQGTIKHACYALLLEAGAAGMTTSSIVDRSRDEGHHNWGTAKTPENSVVAALCTDERFVRVAPSTYALRQHLPSSTYADGAHDNQPPADTTTANLIPKAKPHKPHKFYRLPTPDPDEATKRCSPRNPSSMDTGRQGGGALTKEAPVEEDSKSQAAHRTCHGVNGNAIDRDGGQGSGAVQQAGQKATLKRKLYESDGILLGNRGADHKSRKAGFSVEVSDPFESTSLTADDSCANEYSGEAPSKGPSTVALQDAQRRDESATIPKLSLNANNNGILHHQNGSGSQSGLEGHAAPQSLVRRNKVAVPVVPIL